MFFSKLFLLTVNIVIFYIYILNILSIEIKSNPCHFLLKFLSFP